jgi:PAS domain S-box-containing protein
MTSLLRILHLEDNRQDAELVKALLEADGLASDIVRVDSREAFANAIAGPPFDIILADYNLPSFDGLSAQTMAAAARPETPFIFLSGTLGEEVAVERLKAGAIDYVLKQRIARLPSSVRRALAESADRAERQRAEEEVWRLNQELEQRVVARTAELAYANEALARREADQRGAKSLLEDLIAASPSILCRLEPSDQRVTYVSPNIGWLLGYGAEEVLGLPNFWSDLIHADDRERMTSAVDAAIEAQEVQIEQEYRLRSKDGRYRWFFSLTRVEYDDDMRPQTMLRYYLDIADRRAAEDGMKAARLEAERANLAKSDFLSRMSHDLRTPLNAVMGFAQLLDADALNPEQHESVRQILRGGRYLLDLINEVLDLARIEAGHLSLAPEPVDAGDIVRRAVALVGPLALERGVTLSVEEIAGPALCVQADRQRLTQVVLNLLSNGVKYTSSGGSVTIAFEAGAEERVRIVIRDTGAGIPAEKLPLLFTPFERLGAEHTATEGTGLGLALARGLVEAMKGTMGVTSDLDRGTVFWIELARSRDVARAGASHTAPPAPLSIALGTAGTILYIEDNLSNVKLIQRVLQRRPNITLLHAADGQRGLDMTRHHRPDMVLLDLNLPDLSGEAVLLHLKADPSLGLIPVVVLSADAMPAQTRRLTAAGARAYLTKPLDVAQVLQLVDDILR